MKCDIIAAGESLRGFDFSQLTNYRIVLNNVCWHIPHDMCVWFDPIQKFYSQEEISKINNLETLTTNGGRWVKSNVRDIVRGSYVSMGFDKVNGLPGGAKKIGGTNQAASGKAFADKVGYTVGITSMESHYPYFVDSSVVDGLTTA